MSAAGRDAVIREHRPSGLSDEARARAREVAAAMPPWTDDQLDELDRILDAAPALALRDDTSPARRRAG